jgi:PIN domain nuclease of toxin-antitoxin system
VTLLLDAHALLWWLADDRQLSEEARAGIADPLTRVWVSAVTAWEIGIKRALGKLSAPPDLLRQLQREGFDELPITVADALHAAALPRHHDDPFDRMLVAQAQRRDLTVVTRDPLLRDYGIAVLRA